MIMKNLKKLVYSLWNTLAIRTLFTFFEMEQDWLISKRGQKIYKKLTTKNGIHIITCSFNLQKFKQDYPEIEVHKDNPINLYIP